MKGSKVAARYAKALLEISIEKGILDQVANDMSHLYETQEQNRELVSLFNSPIVGADKKIEILKEVFGAFEPASRDFVELITKNGRENHLPEIAASFATQVKEYKGIVAIEIVSATALNEDTKNTILAKVQTTVKGTLEVTEKIDPSIIGGFIVKMGDRRIDASVSSQINKLKQSLTH
ncbi:MAG: ATP synthase F1 subunit delta [Bacteroidetes bacterium]|nr:ATP synthase F1 subunit delta [Bacteroidota bacterium]